MLFAVFESVGNHTPYHFRVLCSFVLRKRVTKLIQNGRYFGDGEGGSTGSLGEINKRIVVGPVDPIRATALGQKEVRHIERERSLAGQPNGPIYYFDASMHDEYGFFLLLERDLHAHLFDLGLRRR